MRKPLSRVHEKGRYSTRKAQGLEHLIALKLIKTGDFLGVRHFRSKLGKTTPWWLHAAAHPTQTAHHICHTATFHLFHDPLHLLMLL